MVEPRGSEAEAAGPGNSFLLFLSNCNIDENNNKNNKK